MESMYESNKPKGFLFGELLTSVRSVIQDARFMSDMAMRCAPSLSISPQVFLLIVAYVLFVVAKKVSGHTRTILHYVSVAAFLAAVWQYILTKIAKDMSAWA